MHFEINEYTINYRRPGTSKLLNGPPTIIPPSSDAAKSGTPVSNMAIFAQHHEYAEYPTLGW